MKVRGHTLIWHAHIPNYLLKEKDKNVVKNEIKSHINTVVSRYKGKIHVWDVINEVIKVEDGQPNGMRASHWYNILGEDYIDVAFRTAHQADPEAILVYNEWGAELNTKFGREKRAAILSLLKRLKDKNVPIHGFGLQSHLGAKSSRYIDDSLKQFISDVHKLGLKVYVTELDVNDKNKDASTVDRATQTYEKYLSTVLATGHIEEIITWGVRNSNDLSVSQPNSKLRARALVYSKGSNTTIENVVKKTILNAPQQK